MDKLYNPSSADTPRASEPATTYGHAASAVPHRMAKHSAQNPMEADDADLKAFMNADLSELGDGFRPFTWEEARQWVAWAEEDIAAGKVLSHEEVMREMYELIVSYED